MKTVRNGTLLFRLAKALDRRGWRGADFLLRNLERRHLLDYLSVYEFNGIPIGVPARDRIDRRDLQAYEPELIAMLCVELRPLNKVTLFDCGAYEGIVGSMICAHTPSISRLVAYEPNTASREVLRWNLSALPIESRLEAKAVSNFEGRGRLVQANYNGLDVASYLEPGPGDIAVTTIDRAEIRGGNIGIKIDVEGEELKVIEGAQETIGSAEHCVIAFEAHPLVAKRIGQDPLVCIERLLAIRRFSFVVAETGDPVPVNRPVLRPGQSNIWNVVGTSL